MKNVFSTKLRNLSSIAGVVLIVVFFLFLTLSGGKDLNYYKMTLNTRATGPFESSNSRSRYALTKSLVDDNSVFLSRDLAAFSLPDVVSYNGKYFSIFAPGVSLAAVPFYILGRIFGFEQAITFLLNAFFAIFSVIFILILTQRITRSLIAGAISGLIFLLATNVLVYSHTLTQHMISTFLLLTMIYNVLYIKSSYSYLLSGILYGIGLVVDIPNLFILAPALLVSFAKAFFYNSIQENPALQDGDELNADMSSSLGKPRLLRRGGRHSHGKARIKFSFDFRAFLLLVGVLPFVLSFGYYNYVTAESPFRVAQIVGRIQSLEERRLLEGNTLKDTYEHARRLELPFYTRLIPNGLYILLLSNERGIFYYSPVLALGILGLVKAVKEEKTKKFVSLYIASCAIIIFIYSMFGDPWGGWSFGPRYLIPLAAILSVFVGFAFVKYVTRPWFAAAFFIFLFYSITVNALGALTTSSVPPKQEALNLVNPSSYTFGYNLDFLSKNLSSSYLYNSLLAGKFYLKDYFIFIVLAESFVFLTFYYYYLLSLSKKR